MKLLDHVRDVIRTRRYSINGLLIIKTRVCLLG